MVAALKHEKWYQCDYYANSSFGMGRVGPGVLNPEPQPVFSEDRSVSLCLEGEIFNGSELAAELKARGHRIDAESQAEIILHSYKDLGEGVVSRLDGSFALAIWDGREHKLLLITDRFGTRPLYYAHYDGKLAFGSEIKAILADSGFKRKVNDGAVADFFAFDCVLGDKTLFQDIHLLPPATVLYFQSGRVSLKQYWVLDFDKKHKTPSFIQCVNDVDDILSRSLAKRLKSVSKVGLLLSGGVDSRLLAGKLGNGADVHAFTFGMTDCDDARLASAVAGQVGIKHTVLGLEPDYLLHYAPLGVLLTEGMQNCTHFHGISVLTRIKDVVPLVVTGAGGELIGQRYFNEAELATCDERSLVQVLCDNKYVRPLFSEQEASNIFTRNYYGCIRGSAFDSIRGCIANCSGNHPADKAYQFFLSNRVRRFVLQGPLLFSSQLEYHVPYLDYELMDFVQLIPYRWRRKVVRMLLRRNKLLGVGYSFWERAQNRINRATRGLVPRVPWRPYADYGKWMRSHLRGFVENVLLDEQTLARGYFDPRTLSDMVNSHMEGIVDYSHLLGAILTFALWHRLFIDQEPTDWEMGSQTKTMTDFESASLSTKDEFL